MWLRGDGWLEEGELRTLSAIATPRNAIRQLRIRAARRAIVP
jgi:hypothetical protein